MQQFQQYIGGQFEDGTSQFDSFDPATSTAWAQMPAASAADVDRAVQAAEDTFFAPDWSLMTASQRGKLLLRLDPARLR